MKKRGVAWHVTQLREKKKKKNPNNPRENVRENDESWKIIKKMQIYKKWKKSRDTWHAMTRYL